MKRTLSLVALGSTLAFALPIRAGYKTEEPVSISEGWARGALGYAYNDPDTAGNRPSINCKLGRSGTQSFVYCSAHNGTAWRNCYTQGNVAPFIEALRGISGDSFVFFSWDTDGTCLAIEATSHSAYEPKR